MNNPSLADGLWGRRDEIQFPGWRAGTQGDEFRPCDPTERQHIASSSQLPKVEDPGFVGFET